MLYASSLASLSIIVTLTDAYAKSYFCRRRSQEIGVRSQ